MGTCRAFIGMTMLYGSLSISGCTTVNTLGTTDQEVVRSLHDYQPIGGTAGAIIGYQMDNLVQGMRRSIANGTIERVGEGIRISFDSEILFATNSSRVQPGARVSIESLAVILNHCPETEILVTGYTDNTGTGEYYRRLSEQRADSITEYLRNLGVESLRLKVAGRGDSDPVASNISSEGRRQNRRLELVITANDAMKNAARNNERVCRN